MIKLYNANIVQRALEKMGTVLLKACEDPDARLFPHKPEMVHAACGLEWTATDIARFLRHTRTVRSKSSPIGYCRIWCGAKSRGQGNSQWYGSFWLPGYNGKKGKSVRAHKFAAVAILGLRPGPGEHLDHACKTTLCTGCIRQMTKKENEDLIRRPKKRHLDLAKQLNITPAEAMDLEEHHPNTLKGLEALLDAAAQIQAGKIPPGVIVTPQRRKERSILPKYKNRQK